MTIAETGPIWSMASEIRAVVEPASLGPNVFHYSIPLIEATGDGRIEAASDIKSAKLRLRGDEVLISKLNPRKSRVVMARPSEVPIVCSTEFVALRPRRVDPRFLYYCLSSETVRQDLDSRVQSVTRSHQRVDPADVMRLKVWVPELGMQRRIVDFLDAECSRITLGVERRIQQSALVAERFEAETLQAFSGCTSGRSTKLKYLLAQRPTYGVLVPEFVDDGVPFIRVQDLGHLEDESLALRKIPHSLSKQYRRTILRTGDVLVSVVGTLGRSAIVPTTLDGANINRAVACLRFVPHVDRSLIVTWLGSREFQNQALDATASDSAQRTLGMEDMANFVLRWPENPGEQALMSATVKKLQLNRNTVRNAIDRQVEVLRERRQALITAAVTGQIDVTTARGVG